MWVGDADSWGGARLLSFSNDSGATWNYALNASGLPYIYEGADVSYGCPGNPAVGFASNWRTADGGATWANMTNATSVHTHDMSPSAAGSPRLFGLNAHAQTVVVSSDQGATWSKLFAWPSPNVVDIAYNWQTGAMLVADGNLWSCAPATGGSSSWSCSLINSIPVDQWNATRTTSVAVDPANPTIVYLAQKKDIYLSWAPIARSLDGGATWASLLLDTPLGQTPDAPLQGPHEVSWVRVHPTTRYLWAAGECYGMWVAPPPAGM